MRRAALAAVCLSALAPASAHAARYTLEQLVAKVSTDYPGVVAARESLSSAAAQVSQANRLYFPMGDFNFGITGSPSVRCQTLDRNPTSASYGTTNGIDQSRRLQFCDSTGGYDIRAGDQFLPTHGVAFNLSFNILQPLYSGGKIEAARAAARAGRDAAKDQVERERADAVLNCERAYWGLKLSRAIEQTLQDGLDKLTTWIKKVQDSLDAGKSDYSESDLARLKLARDQAELIVIDAQRNQEIALKGVRTLVGEDDADIDDSELDLVSVVEQPLSYYEDMARVHRPEARLLDAAAFATHAWKRLKLAELLPDFGLALSFTYGYAQSVDQPLNAFLQHTDVLGAGVFLVMHQPLDFGPRLARLEQARADERAMEQRRKQALGGISWEIESAYANLREARKRYTLTQHGEKVARGWYRAMDDQISAGTSNIRDLADAARQYFEMRLRFLQAILDVNMNVAQLRRVTGVD